MDPGGRPAEVDVEAEKAALHAAVPPTLSPEEDVEQPRRMQLFMADLMAHLFLLRQPLPPHSDIPSPLPSPRTPRPPHNLCAIDRSMPPIVSGGGAQHARLTSLPWQPTLSRGLILCGQKITCRSLIQIIATPINGSYSQKNAMTRMRHTNRFCAMVLYSL
ncbi:hypothetical protein CLOM_g17891 [Closterium sp. NIES-68]|nr:hypothetical protein CLOM_g17891 [Closterium sp. NIES-68]